MTRQYVTVTAEQIERANRLLIGIPNAAPKALARALNRAMEGARTEGISKARAEYHVRAKDVRDTIRLSRATKDKTTAVISSVGPALSLGAFKVNPNTVNGRRRSPIRVAVRKGSAPQEMGNAFIARVGGGQKGIFERLGTARLPIRKLTGPSVPQMLGNDLVIDSMAERARETMDTRLDHEIDNILKRGR